MDEQIIPTKLPGGGGMNVMSEFPDDYDPNEANKAEELSEADRREASLLIEAFGEDVVKKLFSSTW